MIGSWSVQSQCNKSQLHVESEEHMSVEAHFYSAHVAVKIPFGIWNRWAKTKYSPFRQVIQL